MAVAAAPPLLVVWLRPVGRGGNLEVVQGPNQVSRENGKRRVVVTANVRGRDLGSFVDEAEALIAEKVQIPPGYWVTWGGAIRAVDFSRPAPPDCHSAGPWIDFRSALYHVRELSGWTADVYRSSFCAQRRNMWHCGCAISRLSISAGVGFIALSGVAVLNGLVMLAFIRDLRAQGLTLDDAIQTRRPHEVAAGTDDSTGGSARIHSHGLGYRYRRGSATTARYSSYWGHSVIHRIDAAGIAGAVPSGSWEGYV